MFQDKDEKRILYKSEYDRPNSADEESYVYWNNSFGVSAVYNYPVGALILYTNESNDHFMRNEFYEHIIRNEYHNANTR